MHVSTFWNGKPLGNLELLSLNSFVVRGHGVDLYAYTVPTFVPSGVVVKNANDVLPRAMLFENPTYPGSFAGFSNIFRYKLLQHAKTTWVDLDVVCLDWPVGESEAYLFAKEDQAGTVNGAVLRAPPESHLVTELLSRALAADLDEIKWGQLGPKLLSRVLGEQGLDNLAKPRKFFYEIGPLETWVLLDPSTAESTRRRIGDAWGVHLWSKVLRETAPELAFASAPDGSIFAEWQRTLLGPNNGVVLSESWARKVRRRQEGYNSLWSRALRRAPRSLFRRLTANQDL